MNATGKRRLLKLAQFLETAELPGKFVMRTWAHEIENGRPACGTAACAAGWATSIPSFWRAGLIFWPDDMWGLQGERGRRIVAKRIRELVASA